MMAKTTTNYSKSELNNGLVVNTDGGGSGADDNDEGEEGDGTNFEDAGAVLSTFDDQEEKDEEASEKTLESREVGNAINSYAQVATTTTMQKEEGEMDDVASSSGIIQGREFKEEGQQELASQAVTPKEGGIVGQKPASSPNSTNNQQHGWNEDGVIIENDNKNNTSIYYDGIAHDNPRLWGVTDD